MSAYRVVIYKVASPKAHDDETSLLNQMVSSSAEGLTWTKAIPG